MTVLTIDAGTTGVTALMVSENGTVLARGYQEFAQHYPDTGWVEHVPEEIWQATLAACQTAIDAAGVQPACLGITNQRETAVLWDRKRATAPRRAIVWQDRRTAGICSSLREEGHEERITELTGLRLDPYFTATKLTWIARNDERAWKGVQAGDVAIGTVDSYIVARLTGGARHITDASNASRTLLYDIRAGSWSPELCELFGVPMEALPEVVPSYGALGETSPEEFLGLRIPIAGIAGDQQAAMFGQTCYSPGTSKCTYGTGSFVLLNTGGEPVAPEHGLLSTVLWQHPDGRLEYALEGSIFVTGAAVQWLRDGLGLIDSAPQSEALATSVPDSGGVVFVPALTGLGAPDWDPQARGAIFGITRGTRRAHLARATLEAIAFEVRDVAEAMTKASGTELPELRVDGGASANNLLCRLQADQLGVSVARPRIQETTALGAAFLAGLGAGVWSSTEELVDTWKLDLRFEPGERDEAAYRRWREAVERSKGWADLG
ncbi:glycerol kinase GlpK [Marinactinospora thermotolerans]|uniref:glycerol kinase n=1 Tax=Marinactinospora thermotolerans DSM 45154 TaxID=1122192 RepID=A0A1T4MFD0_9ACTN|nr:glycerol kinase GlpK [Marinactinospora thermotolerans]SJZ65575.1 glycerol kinase [Marinactinospora thermotolerans DSM 45154]